MTASPRKGYFFAAGVLFLSCSFLASGQTNGIANLDWRQFTSEAGGFSVKFPGTPTIQDFYLQKGPVVLTRHTHNVSAGPLEFDVEYVEMPVGYSDPAMSLEGGISGLTHSTEARGGRLLTKGTLVRGNCEGQEATFLLAKTSTGKSGYSHARIFSSGQRYYFLVLVATEDSPAIRGIANTFMESFSVTGGCTTAITPTTAPSRPTTVENIEGMPDPATGWRRIESAQLGFSVLMPGAVVHETAQTQVEPFPLTHNSYSHETDTSIYSAEVFGDFPPNFRTTEVHYQTALDLTLYTLKKTLEPVGFVLVPSRELRVGAFPGREFSITNTNLGGQGRAQVYVTAKYIYIFIGFDHAKPIQTSSIDRFFSSIKISPK